MHKLPSKRKWSKIAQEMWNCTMCIEPSQPTPADSENAVSEEEPVVGPKSVRPTKTTNNLKDTSNNEQSTCRLHQQQQKWSHQTRLTRV